MIKVSGIIDDPCGCQADQAPKKKDRDRLVEFRGVTLRTSSWEIKWALRPGTLKQRIVEWGQEKAMAASYLSFKRRFQAGLIGEDRRP